MSSACACDQLSEPKRLKNHGAMAAIHFLPEEPKVAAKALSVSDSWLGVFVGWIQVKTPSTTVGKTWDGASESVPGSIRLGAWTLACTSVVQFQSGGLVSNEEIIILPWTKSVVGFPEYWLSRSTHICAVRLGVEVVSNERKSLMFLRCAAE